MKYIIIRREGIITAVQFRGTLLMDAAKDQRCQVWIVNAISPTKAINAFIEMIRTEERKKYYSVLSILEKVLNADDPVELARLAVENSEREKYIKAVEDNGYNIQKTAKALGVDRKTVWRWTKDCKNNGRNGNNGHQ